MKILTVLLHAFIGWFLCAMVMAVGPIFMNMDATLIIHLIGAPIFFGALSYFYHKKYNYTKPLLTAVIFVSFVILVDFLLVAAVLLKDFSMFQSVIGTWLPFLLLFLSAWLVGKRVNS